MKMRSDERLEELGEKILERAKEGMGYQPFGIDWPTLRITRPLLCSALKMVFNRLDVPVVERVNC